MGVGIRWASSGLAWIVLLAAALPAAGQLEVGNNLSMDLNGTIGAGYAADYGNLASSTHSLSASGTGTLSGSYFNPNFLSFTVSPYYGQSRANSNYQSVFDSSGVNVATSIFSGSRFPGSISYAKSYNSQGSFGVPGVADYTTKGDSDTFGLAWSENIPDDPSLSVSFQRGSNQYSIFGTNEDGNSTFHSATVRSGYLIQGFGLGAFYENGGSHSLVPELAGVNSGPEDISSGNSGYGFNVTHPLPMRGGFSSAFTRTSFETGLEGSNYNGNVDLVTANAGIQPTDRLHFSVGANYSDSLTGQLYEQIVSAGGVIPTSTTNESSHGVDVIGSASYAITKSLQSEGDVERREQRFLGEDFGSNTYSAGLLYTTALFGGNFNAAGSVRDSTIDGSSQNALGFSTTANFTRRINNWVMSGSFSYSQNVETLLISYMASFYNYSGNIRHRWGQFTWSAGASAGRTGLTEQKGAENSGESFTTGIGYSRFLTLTGTYTKSSGTGVQSANGLVVNPVVVPVLTPSEMILFSGDTYSIALGSSPAKRLTLAASYARANDTTGLDGVTSSGSNIQYNGLFQYQFRKVYLTGGYSRLQQGFNTSTTGPAIVSSFYIGLSRWFNFF